MFTPAILLTLFACATGTPSDPPRAPVANVKSASTPPTLDEILSALRGVETGGSKSGGRHATGDGGSAIGPYQIHKNYWKDARLPGSFEDCRDPAYARSVVLAYWKRYAPKALAALDAEVLSRVHNGGPDGHTEACTVGFWNKVRRELDRQREKREAETRATPPTQAPANAPRPEATPRTDVTPRPAPQPRRKLPPRPELV
jgi:hypothetical protein